MASNPHSLLSSTRDYDHRSLDRTSYQSPRISTPLVDYQDQSKDREGLISHAEMCKELGISSQAGYDWRNPRSPRYKVDLAKIAIYLSERTVRFRREDVQAFALQRKQEGNHELLE